MEEEHQMETTTSLLQISKPIITNPMTSAMLGRVMSTLLTSKPKKLSTAISTLSTSPPPGSLGESLKLLLSYVKEAVEVDGQPLDDVLVPMIENVLKSDSKHANQAMLLLNWLFQDEALCLTLIKDLTDVLTRREDRFIKLGWCRLIRSLVKYEKKMTQFSCSGFRDNYQALLEILSSSIKHLSAIVCGGSVLQDGFELPSRLAVAAADCILVLTEALTKKPSDCSNSSEKGASISKIPKKPISVIEKKQVGQQHVSSAVFNNVDHGLLLWQQLDLLILVVQKLQIWSQKSQCLRSKGLGEVLKWLHEIKSSYVSAEDDTGSQLRTTGVLLLCSCWKHYSVLSLLEDTEIFQRCDELVEQYLSAIQLYTEDKDHLHNECSSIATRKFFLNCLALLLGRLDSKRLENVTTVYGLRISHVLMSQLHCSDENVTEGAVCILKHAIFKVSGSSPANSREMEALLPSLIDLLDECDGAARAVVVLIAEYCSISQDHHCLQEVLKRLASGSVPQRRNALDVVSEIVRISANSEKVVYGSIWQDVANQLLACLGDEESLIRAKACTLLPHMDPSLVLPKLVHTICSADYPMGLAAGETFLEILRKNKPTFDVIRIFLDSLRDLYEMSDAPGSSHKEDTSTLDVDKVFQLIPEWSNEVQDWNFLAGPLIDKMFSEPRNAIIIRFLSFISEHLADAADIVLGRLISRAQEQGLISRSMSDKGERKIQKTDDSDSMENTIFDRLCPLLIVKMLPLRVFNTLSSVTMYGETLSAFIAQGIFTQSDADFDICGIQCVATLLLNRAFSPFEYEDVKKLAAELCGRIHPQVLLPVICSQLQNAVERKDILNMKACLFALCTSFAIRGWDSFSQPHVVKIIRVLHTVLLWPSEDGDAVSKAQHGCTDCLALMICSELQAPKVFRGSALKKSPIVFQNAAGMKSSSVLELVIDYLTDDKFEAGFLLGLVEDLESNTSYPISFRLCMANVLISTFQKISEPCKKPFGQKTIPRLIDASEVIVDARVRAACIQVLFSAAYHLKSLIFPYAHDLLRLSMKFLTKDTEQERMAGARLMASLMASEDVVMERIAGGLLEARSILLNVSSSDPSPQLRQICQKLVECLTS